MTLYELEALPDDVITCSQAAQFLKVNPETLRCAARTRPEMLGFPVTVIKSRVLISRKGFLRFLKGEGYGI